MSAARCDTRECVRPALVPHEHPLTSFLQVSPLFFTLRLLNPSFTRPPGAELVPASPRSAARTP